MPPWSTDSETETLEKTPLLDSDPTPTYYTLKRVRHHSPNSSINSQESGPSGSRSPNFRVRRCISAEALLSSSADEESGERTSSISPNSQCTYTQQNQSLSSKSEPCCNVTLRKWVELRLENSGSVARDHLASERTFLAYVRTSIAIASSGVGESLLYLVSERTEG